MTSYILRRIGTALLVVLGVTMVTFALLHVISSSPGRAELGLGASPAAVAAFDKAQGYDRPLALQYLTYLEKLIHLNLGYSYRQSQSVGALLTENAGRTVYLSGMALVISILVAIPLGIFQAVRRNTVPDYAATAVSFSLYSMPSFFLGLILIQVFALKLGWFPAEGSQSTTTLGAIENVRSMVLPILTLAAINVASYSRYMRSAALTNLGQDYIRLARAKGLPERLVLARHLVRNSCLPILTLVGLSIPSLLVGNLLIEQLFNYPGLGLLFYNSLQNEDYPVLLAYALLAGVTTVVGNLLADLALAFADPRIRLS